MAMVLDALVSAVLEKLLDKAIGKIVSVLGVKGETKKLQSSIQSTRSLLEIAKSKKIEDRTINLWLAKLREVMYDVEDLLDDWQVKADKKIAAAGETSWRAKLASTLPSKLSQSIFSVTFRSKIVTRIENINSNLSRINSEAPTVQLLASQPNAEKKVSRYNSSRIIDTCSNQVDSDIVGIDDDATDLVDRITGDSNRAHSLFAITGMGGIGKTTLARKVFNHDQIQNHFQNKVWVCVSSNCTGEYLLKEIVRSIDKNYSESGVSQNELSSKLSEVVKEKRVFIVLDDIWKSDVWEKFLSVPLSKAEKHSRILITTRNKNVAKAMNAAHTHSMTHMLPSDGWSMLCKIVFKEEDKGGKDELEKVGKEIVDRCKGLPLAVHVVGGVLKLTDRNKDAWTIVLSSTTWSIQDLPEDILPSLLLSYEDLPLHLKQCFTYCSLFPEDYKFFRFKLENLWIAEGFIEKVEGKDVEYSAREYYNELVTRNLLQEFSLNTFDMDYDSTYCKMHDLLRSLAIFVSQKQYIYLKPKDFHKNGLSRRHHLSLIGNDMNDEEVSQEIKEEDRVRTLLLSRNHGIRMVPPELLSSLRRLRVLDLQATGIETLPDTLGTLIHLRFLNVSVTNLKELPDSTKNLKNLQTLVATGLSHLRSLPMGISALFNLRCLRVDRLDNMPNGLDNMKNLRILDEFVVNDRISSGGRRYTPNLKELKDLSQLTHLTISNLERVGSKEEAEEAAMEKKTSLKCLILSCKPRTFTSDEDIKKIEEVFAGIRIPENLTYLLIAGFFGKQLPDHITSDRLRQLTSLNLGGFESLTRLPSLGDLPKLQRLEIAELDSVVELGSEFLGKLKFPKLQELKLEGMWKLERMFDVEEVAFPCLVKLFITRCPMLNSLGEGWNHATCLETLEVTAVENLKSIENLPSLKRMTIWYCPALEDVNEVGELDFLEIFDAEMKTLPRWLENITPPKELLVEGSEEMVLGIQESVEAQNIIKKCLHAEVRSYDGSNSCQIL